MTDNADARDTRAAAELAARTSYGRLVAFLSARSRDVAAAEDALSEAFVDALETWPVRGVPRNPEGWLLTTARRRLLDAGRHDRVRAAAPLDLAAEVAAPAEGSDAGFPDERLKLLFACAHPAIDEAARTPLMLQTVLGLDAARIASAFLTAPAAMGQRLVRAKAKIRDAGIGFEVPDGPDLPARLGPVLDAVYVAYGSGWDDVAGADPRRRGLADEAVWLGGVLAELLPAEPEAAGLYALMLYCESRRSARRTADGRYVPLADQDCGLWSRPLIVRAEQLLTAAAAAQRPGRYQFEAAIQSAHAQRAVTGRVDWRGVALLYEGLAGTSPTVGALVGRAAARGEALGPAAGLAALDQIPSGAVVGYQPYWALAAHLLGRQGRSGEARAALERAIGLSEDPAVRAFLLSSMSPDPGSGAGT
jgi:predicted RNA polymerase sigma factor